MDYFPIFMNVSDQTVLVIGGNEDSLHKVRLLRKTSANIIIHGDVTDATLQCWIDEGHIQHNPDDVAAAHLGTAIFAYIGVHDPEIRDAAITLFKAYRLPYSVIDDKARSAFITPAMVDRDPVVIAIGTEGTGPIIARDIKARIERELHPLTGLVAKVAGLFRPNVEHLPHGQPRRRFWQRYLDEVVPEATKGQPEHAEDHLNAGLKHLLSDVEAVRPHQPRRIRIVNVAAGSADLLTRQALRWLHDADVIVHDADTPLEILELTRRESQKVTFAKNNLNSAQSATMLKAAHDSQSVLVLVKDGVLPFKEELAYMAGIRIEHAAFIKPERQAEFLPVQDQHLGWMKSAL